MNFKILSSACLALFVAGCGGGGGSSDVDSDLVGVWKSTDYKVDGDVYYSVIKSNGDVFSYDYMGDSFDGGNNCYLVSQGAKDLTSSDTEVSFSNVGTGEKHTITYDISENTLTLDGDETYERSSLNESDLTPNCESSSGGEGDSSDGDGFSADLAGVWKSTDYKIDGDEWYIEIKSNGDIFSYDYAGDSFDEGDNCYWNGQGGSSFTTFGSTASYFDFGEGETVSYSYSLSGNTLTIGSNSYEKSSLVSSDFSPECD